MMDGSTPVADEAPPPPLFGPGAIVIPAIRGWRIRQVKFDRHDNEEAVVDSDRRIVCWVAAAGSDDATPVVADDEGMLVRFDGDRGPGVRWAEAYFDPES